MQKAINKFKFIWEILELRTKENNPEKNSYLQKLYMEKIIIHKEKIDNWLFLYLFK